MRHGSRDCEAGPKGNLSTKAWKDRSEFAQMVLNRRIRNYGYRLEIVLEFSGQFEFSP